MRALRSATEVFYRTFQAMFDNNLHLSHLKIKLDVKQLLQKPWASADGTPPSHFR